MADPKEILHEFNLLLIDARMAELRGALMDAAASSSVDSVRYSLSKRLMELQDQYNAIIRNPPKPSVGQIRVPQV